MQNENNRFLITPDLSEAVELGGIPAGTYKARVTGIDLKDNKAMTGKYFQWELTVFGLEGPLAGFNNWKVLHRTMTSGKGAGMLKAFFKVCTGQELKGTTDFSLLVGSEIEITLVEGKNQDGSPSKYPEIKAIKELKV